MQLIAFEAQIPESLFELTTKVVEANPDLTFDSVVAIALTELLRDRWQQNQSDREAGNAN